jgi:phage tail-like protein
MADLPEIPEIPELPEIPDVPEIPSIPEMPSIPEIPSLPSLPAMPAVPDIPGMPDVPEPPGPPDIAPEMPDISDASPASSDRASANSASAHDPDPVGELRFQVLIDNHEIGAFAECSGLSAEYDIFEYQEGGQLEYVHKFRGGLKYPNLVLKRGVTHEDEFLKWFLDRSTDREDRGTVTLNLLGDDGEQVRTWTFSAAFPVKWTGPSFSAKSTNIATETLEIAHQGLTPPE